jgi:DNA-binding MarR family transcriptional regulator
MSVSPAFGAPLIGQTENALRTILERQLAETGLTYSQWVTLTLAVAIGGELEAEQLTGRLAEALGTHESDARADMRQLAFAGLIHAIDEPPARVTVTNAGRRLHSNIGGAVAEVTQRLWGDLAPDDLAVAARVLDTILARAHAQLSEG